MKLEGFTEAQDWCKRFPDGGAWFDVMTRSEKVLCSVFVNSFDISERFVRNAARQILHDEKSYMYREVNNLILKHRGM